MRVKKSCAACTSKFTASRAGQKFCSARCRSRAYREAKASPKAAPTVERPRAASGSDGELEASVREELVRAKRENTFLGKSALALARQVDAGRDTGSVVTSLIRELRNTMAAATLGADRPDDPLDEITERRRARLYG